MRSNFKIFHFLLIASLLSSGPAKGQDRPQVPEEKSFTHEMPIIIHGSEPESVDMDLPDGGLPPLPGVHNFQLLRSSRDVPEMAEQEGWTYAHHQDLAAWKGKLYAAWAMTPIDEDLPPYKVLYATSEDGLHWSEPADLFPRGIAWAARFYFYQAKNGVMLALAAGKIPDVEDITEAVKNVLLVREVSPDHHLGKVYALIGKPSGPAPSYETDLDPEFILACQEAIDNNVLLEQSDYGNYLGERRMKWHSITPKYKGFYPFGKAFCFYHRADGKLVGVCKMGFTTLSSDEGKTWTEPVLPPTLKTGAAKVWGQQTPDEDFILVYNPDDVQYRRYPLVLVQGKDGREFNHMRVVHGEYPIMRYPGRYKDFGAQYVRGLAEWSNDNSLDKDAVWLIYSVHKEDIWIARVPLPLRSSATDFPVHDFQQSETGGIVDGWNIYAPRWAPVNIVEEAGQQDNLCLSLKDADPYDYPRAKCLFPESRQVEVNMKIKPMQSNARFDVELADGYGRRPFRLSFLGNGRMYTQHGDYSVDLGDYTADNWMAIKISCDQETGEFELSVNGRSTGTQKLADAGGGPLQLIDFRTGPWRGITRDPLRYNHDYKQSDSHFGPVPAGTDKPLENAAVFLVDDIVIQDRSR